MPSPPLQTFALIPHPATVDPSLRGIGGTVSRSEGGLKVSYMLEGELASLRVLERKAPCFADELWRHTCFELFVAREGEPRYREFNFSPSGEWAEYAFSTYRQRAAAPGFKSSVRVDVSRTTGKLELNAAVSLERRYAEPPLVLGLSAVIEAGDGTLSYWALKHPRPEPDFHHPDACALTLDEIRN